MSYNFITASTTQSQIASVLAALPDNLAGVSPAVVVAIVIPLTFVVAAGIISLVKGRRRAA